MGRTRSRGAREVAERDRPRAVVREFSGAASRRVEFDARTTYDFFISLTIGEGKDNDLLPEDQRWLRDARAGLREDLRGDLDACFGDESSALFHDLAGLPLARPELRDAAQLVAALEECDWREIVHTLVIGYGTEAASLADEVLAGDRDALDRLMERVPDYHQNQLRQLLADPEPRIDRMREAMRAWLPSFREVEPRVLRMAERDVAARSGDRATLPTPELIERTTGGLRFLPDPQVRRVVLAPSYFARPYNYLFNGPDWRLFCYPIADAAVGEDDGVTPPAQVVRMYRALGDPTRLRVLKLLGERDWYLTELAQQLELSKPTMKHHLAQLRAAGLVTVIEEGTLTYYSLRRQQIDAAGAELRRYLD